MSKENSIFSKPVLFSVMVLIVILVGTIVTAFYPLVRDEMHPQLENHEAYTLAQLAGRDIYQREGCMNCHTQVVRPLKSEVLRYGDYSKGGESAGERPFLWGSKRTGPDLARIGGKYLDEWHFQHFMRPQLFAERSNMPSYGFLAGVPANVEATKKHMKALGLEYTDDDVEELSGMDELQAITAYTQVIGTAVEPLQLVTLDYDDYKGNPAAGNPDAAVRGEALYMSECSGCHGKEHEGNIGGSLRGFATGMDDATAFAVIGNGFHGMMPGFANTMTRMQIGSIVQYLKTFTETDTDSGDSE